MLASFVQPSGLEVIRAGLFSALAAGARVRLLVGDYLGITSPEALLQLLGWMDLTGEKGGWLGGSATCLSPFSVRLAELENLRGSPDSFHPKAWRIADSSGGIVVVGSSNLSRAALISGVEWNLLGETSGSGPLDRELVAAFDDLWQQATRPARAAPSPTRGWRRWPPFTRAPSRPSAWSTSLTRAPTSRWSTAW